MPLAQGFDEVFYPSEIEVRNDKRNRLESLISPEETIEDLKKFADEPGLEENFLI